MVGSGRVRLLVGSRGSGRVNVLPGRVGSKKSDPWTTLGSIRLVDNSGLLRHSTVIE